MTIKNFTGFVLLILFTAACGGESQNNFDLSTAPSFDNQIVTEITETDEYLFTGLGGLIIHKSGNVLFHDAEQALVYYADQSGNILQVFGGKGEGPGEFERIAGMRFLDDDEILVSDMMRQRDSKFQLINNEWVFIEAVRLWEDMDFRVGSWHKLHDGNFLVNETIVLMQPPSSAEIVDRDMIYRVVNFEDKTVKRELLYTKASPFVISMSGQGGFMVASLPFGHSYITEVSPNGYIYTGFSDQ